MDNKSNEEVRKKVSNCDWKFWLDWREDSLSIRSHKVGFWNFSLVDNERKITSGNSRDDGDLLG